MLYDSASSAPASSSSCCRTRAAFVDVDSPMTPSSGERRPQPGKFANRVGLPGANRRDERRGHGVRGEHLHHGLTLFGD